MSQLPHILNFTQLLHDYRKVERVVLVQGSGRLENDTEHSFTLAMLAWYIITTHNLDLNIEKILKYALVHDMVEVYAGDTFIYTKNKDLIASKHEREAAAAKKLKDTYPEFIELHELIVAYENKSDPESVFIYALDKIEPMLSIYLDNGKTWRQEDIKLEMLINLKGPQVAKDPTIAKIFKEFTDILQSRKQELFG